MATLKRGVKHKSVMPSTLPLLLAACGGGGRGPDPQSPIIPSDIVVDIKEFTAFQGIAISGNNTDGQFGLSASSSGDINGDGINDVIFSARQASPNGVYKAGETYVIFGSDGGFPDSLNLSGLGGSNGFTLTGIDEIDISGAAISFAGDVNGDGLDDIIIGAPNANRQFDSFPTGESGDYMSLHLSAGMQFSYEFTAGAFSGTPSNSLGGWSAQGNGNMGPVTGTFVVPLTGSNNIGVDVGGSIGAGGSGALGYTALMPDKGTRHECED